MLSFGRVAMSLSLVFALKSYAQENPQWNSAPSTYNFNQLEADWILKSRNMNELNIRAGVNFAYLVEFSPSEADTCTLRFKESKYDRILPAESEFKIKAVKNSDSIENFRKVFLQPLPYSHLYSDKQTKLTYLEADNAQLGEVQLTCNKAVFRSERSGENFVQSYDMYPLSLHVLSCAFYPWMKKTPDSLPNKPLSCPTAAGKVKGRFYTLNLVSGVLAENQYFEFLSKGEENK